MDSWQFWVTLFFSLIALFIGVKALISSRKLERIIGGDEPSIILQWYQKDDQTLCNLAVSGEIKDAFFKIGEKRIPLTQLERTHSQSLLLPFVERGVKWEIVFIDPATKKMLREKGLVRYE